MMSVEVTVVPRCRVGLAPTQLDGRLLLRWDTKPDKRIRRAFPRPASIRRTSFYAADRARWLTMNRCGAESGGSEGVDNAYAAAWRPGIGAKIMGRNKLGPQAGAWQDAEGKGRW